MEEWFVGCELQLEPGDVEAERVVIQGLLAKIQATQPVGKASAGSQPSNIDRGDLAACWIEAAGLKRFAIGGAKVSKKQGQVSSSTRAGPVLRI